MLLFEALALRIVELTLASRDGALTFESLALALRVQALALALALRVQALALALALRVEALALALALRIQALALALALRVQALLTSLVFHMLLLPYIDCVYGHLSAAAAVPHCTVVQMVPGLNPGES